MKSSQSQQLAQAQQNQQQQQHYSRPTPGLRQNPQLHDRSQTSSSIDTSHSATSSSSSSTTPSTTDLHSIGSSSIHSSRLQPANNNNNRSTRSGGGFNPSNMNSTSSSTSNNIKPALGDRRKSILLNNSFQTPSSAALGGGRASIISGSGINGGGGGGGGGGSSTPSEPDTSSSSSQLESLERLNELVAKHSIQTPFGMDFKPGTADMTDLVNEMFDLMFACEHNPLRSEQIEQTRNMPSKMKLEFIKSSYHSASKIVVTNHQLDSDKKTPKFYYDYLCHVVREKQASLSSRRSGYLMGAVAGKHNWQKLANLSRSLTARVTGSGSSAGASNLSTQSSSSSFNHHLQTGGGGGVNGTDPSSTQTSMNTGSAALKEILSQLRIDCKSQSVSWLLQFLEYGGLGVLFTLLDLNHKKADRKPKHYEIEAELLKVMKMIMNHQRGISELISQPNSLNILIMSLSSPNLPARTSACEFLLAVVTLSYPQGHRLVMNAFRHMMKETKEDFLFQGFIRCVEELVDRQGILGTRVGAKKNGFGFLLVGGTSNDLERESKEFLVSAMTLIRYIIDTASDVEYRIYLRNRMLACGLGRVLKKLKTWAKDEYANVITHAEVIEQQGYEDTSYFIENIELLLQTSSSAQDDQPDDMLNLNNHQDAFNALITSFDRHEPAMADDVYENNANGDEAGVGNYDGGSSDKESSLAYISMIIQHLLVPARLLDGQIRLKYFQLLEGVLSQISLDQTGFFPDFTESFDVSVMELVQKLVNMEEDQQAGIGRDELLQEIRFLHEKNLSLEEEKHHLIKHQQQSNVSASSNDVKTSQQDSLASMTRLMRMEETIKSKDETITSLNKEFTEFRKLHDQMLSDHQADLSNILQALTLSGVMPGGQKSTNQNLLSAVRDDSGYGSSSDVFASVLEPVQSINSNDSSTVSPIESAVPDSASPISSGPPPPPPPPPPIMGGPPPPPPPPPVFGSGVPPPPPPPPFSAASAAESASIIPKRSQQYHPKIKVKRLQWEKIHDRRVKDTLWWKMVEDGGVDGGNKAKELEEAIHKMGVFKDLESMFAAAKPATLIKRKDSDQDVAGLAGAVDAQKTLIEGKKAQNIMILLGSLKQYSIPDLKNAILNVEEGIISESIATQFLVYAPTQEEKELLKPHQSKYKEFRKAEQFLMEMSKIDHFESRLKTIIFKITSKERTIGLEKGFAVALNAFKSLETSTAFQKMLELILMIGNYMNSGSFIGQVHGFRISSINKLVDTKSSDGKKTLLHYLAAMVNEQFQDLKQFLVDLKDVIPGSKLSFQTMKEDLIDLEKSIRLLDSEIQYHQSKITVSSHSSTINNSVLATHHSNDQHGTFLKVMQPFYNKMKIQIEQIRSTYSEMESLFEKIALLYGEEEPKKIKQDEFLAVFRTFMQSFESAIQDHEKEKEKGALLEKRKRVLEEREAAKRERSVSSTKSAGKIDQASVAAGRGGGDTQPVEEGTTRLEAEEEQVKGVMDSLLESLKRGSVSVGGGINDGGGMSTTSGNNNSNLSRFKTPKSRFERSNRTTPGIISNSSTATNTLVASYSNNDTPAPSFKNTNNSLLLLNQERQIVSSPTFATQQKLSSSNSASSAAVDALEMLGRLKNQT